jgi:capsular polysaccharide biosynthesis protein
MARLAGWTGGMPVLVDSKIPGTVRAALPRLLPADAPLVTVPHLAPLRVDRLWCMPNAVYVGFFPGEDVSLADQARWVPAPRRFATLLREVAAMTSEATATPTGIPRLYLGRKPQRQKRMLNDEQIRQVLDRHAFHCVFPEDLGLLEQLRLVRHARFIVAPEGSNASLALLARPGARLCLLSPPSTYRLGADSATFAELGIDATVLTGPSATDSPNYTDRALWSFWNDYRIDADQLDGILGAWLGGN